MRLPAMKYLEGNRKKTQIKFGGLNHTVGARDGELWDMKNLTGDHYPVLASRMPRTKIMDMDVSGGILHWNGLCWIDGCDFYYDGEVKGSVEEGEHTLAAIGPYIVIFPERFYYNTETDVFGDLQAFWQGETLTFGTGVFEDDDWDHIYCEGADWEKLFKVGDAVTIDGCTKDANNRTAVVVHIERDGYMYFEKNTFKTGSQGKYVEQGSEQSPLRVERTVPNLRYICENDNRLWGCDNNRIFASMPGDPFRWNNREGLETDGWDVDTGSPGSFTGCISYQGYPTFFKENYIYKVYGSLPSQYQLADTEAQGVMAGSEKSLAVADGILFYLSRAGVMAYSGGMPQCIAGAFGKQRFSEGVAGSDGVKYYISMRVSDRWGLYVYDAQRGIWFKEDDTIARGFALNAGTLYMQTMNALVAIGEVEAAECIIPEAVPEPEGPIEWYAEFADFTEEDPNKKGISKIQIRLELEEGAMVQVFLMLDSDGQWLPVGSATGEGTKRSYYLPIVPRRADHYRLKMNGIGTCRIHSLTVETYEGSELKSREGRN